MKVLMVNNQSRITGGADRHCFDLADVLRARGHAVRFLATAAGEQCEGDGAFVWGRVDHSSRDTAPARVKLAAARGALWNRASEAAMRALLEDFSPDVVHVHKVYPHLSVSPVIQAARAGVPVVQTVHDYEFVSASPLDTTGARWDAHETRFEYRLLNSALFQIKQRLHVPVVSEWIAVSGSVARVYAAAGVDTTVIPNFTPSRAAPPKPFDERSGVLYAGRLTPDKGVLDVISMAERIPSIRVIIAGAGPLRSFVEEAATRLGNVTFLGLLTTEDVAIQLARAAICLMPSHWEEPGPLTCLEAMSVGTPVVCYPVGGLAEYVQGSGGGRVVKADPAALAAACAQITTDEDVWRRLSAAGAVAAQTTYSPGRYLSSLMEIYMRACSESPQRRHRLHRRGLTAVVKSGGDI